MDNQTDNALKDRIRLVFENFEDPSADEGWLLLREKYPEKNRRPIVWLWWGAAAILLLFFGVSTFINYNHDKPVKVSDHHVKPGRQNIVNIPKPAAVNQAKINHDTIVNKITGRAYQRYAGVKTRAHNKILIIRKPVDMLPSITSINNNLPITVSPAPQKNADSSSMVLTKNIIAKPAAVQSTPYKAVDSINSAIRKPVAAIYKTATNDPDLKKATGNDSKKIHFGIYEATFFNYAKGSTAQINAGAGVTADITISKSLKLSTGVALAQNTLSYAYGLNYGLTASDQLTYSAGTGYIPANRSYNYNARLISLDIPVNLKYEFNTANQSFVSAGLSSGTFINQTYTLGGQQQSQSGFNDFYFARVLNVSFGISYPLGKTNSLVIEPFIKYPLGGLGAQQIFFGSGGLNLKFNLKSSAK